MHEYENLVQENDNLREKNNQMKSDLAKQFEVRNRIEASDSQKNGILFFSPHKQYR